MFGFTVLASGSTGNAIVVTTPTARVLVDAGFSARRLGERLRQAGIEPSSLSAILLSHAHGDHTQGLETFCRQHGTPVICNRATQRVLADGLRTPPLWRLVETGARFRIDELDVTTFPVPHDAVDPMGFVLEWRGARLGIATDLGYADAVVNQALRGIHALILEANYDQSLLEKDQKRPWPVKQRIASRHGHLSNLQAAELVAALAPHGLTRVVLAHLSRDCNTPELAVRTVANALAPAVCHVHCATQEALLGHFQVGPARSDHPGPDDTGDSHS